MSEWKEVKLSDISHLQYGYTATSKKINVGPKYLRITDIVKDTIDWDNVPFCKIEEKKISKYLLNIGDIVVARTGNTVGYAKLIRKDIFAVFASYLIRIQLNQTKADPNYVGRLIESNIFKKYIHSMKSGAAQPNANAEVIGRFQFCLPPLKTQQKIASILSTYDDLIENNNRRITILEEMAQKLYREWFVKFRFPGYEEVKMVESELGLIPEGWEVKRIDDFGKVVTGKTPSKKREEYYGNDVPFIKTPDMHNGIFVINTNEYLTYEGADSQKNKYLPPKSISVSCIGTVGIVSINAISAQTNQQINSVVLKESFFLEFLYFALLDLKSTIQNYGSTGATMANLSKGKFEQLKIIVPSQNLIKYFHKIVSPLFNQILIFSKKNINLKQQRDLLLPKLISGKIDVL